MLIRSRAPLRIGLAGGGTDVSPYSDLYGGAVLNATINYYAMATIKPKNDGKITLKAIDLDESASFETTSQLPINGELDLLKGVYNRLVKQFNLTPLSFELTTHVEAPKGSGLGASSTLVVAIIGAFTEWLKLPLGEYDIAHLAFDIERIDLAMAGGKQDQYAATFGGFNFMEFYKDDKVIVNPLRIKDNFRFELETNLLLYYTGTSRLSPKIIQSQTKNFTAKSEKSLEAAHKLKEQAQLMKEAILRGKLNDIGQILDFGWQQKKQTASDISNPLIDQIYDAAKQNGASGGKISGAGGGGFMMFYAPENSRFQIMKALEPFGGEFRRFSFVQEGLTSWTI